MQVAATAGGWDVEKQERAGAMIEKVDGVARGAHVAAQRADGLGERANLNIHAAVQVEMVHGAASICGPALRKSGRRQSSMMHPYFSASSTVAAAERCRPPWKRRRR